MNDHTFCPPEYILNNLFECIENGLFIVDHTLYLTGFNSTLLQWLCQHEISVSNDCSGHPLAEAFPFLPEQCIEDFQRVFQTKKPRTTEVIIDENNQEIPVEIRIIPIIQEEKVPSAIAIIRDISQRKRIEILLKVQRDFGSALNETSDLQVALGRLFETVLQIEEIDCGTFYLIDGESGMLHLVYHKGLSPGFIESASHFKAGSPYAQIASAGQPLYGTYLEIAPTKHEVRMREGLKGMAIIPVLHEERAVAVLNLGSHMHKALPRNARTMVEAVVAQMGSFITRVRVEAALRESEERFRNIFESANDCLIYLDTTGKIQDINEQTKKLFGLSKHEFIGKHFHQVDIFFPHDIPQINTVLSQILSGQEPIHEIRVKNRRGDATILECSASMLKKEATLIGATIIARDITDRVQAEKDIQEREEMFRNLSENSPNMIFINSSGKVVYANNRCTELLDYDRDEFIDPGFDFMNLIAPESRGLIRHNFSRHMQGEEIVPYEYRLITRGGMRIDALISTRLIQYKGERSILGIVADITALKQAQKDLNESEEKYRKQFEESLDAIVIADGDTGIILDCNRAACSLVNRSKEDLVGHPQLILHPSHEHESEVSTTFWQFLTEHEGETIESQVLTSLGEIKDVEIKATRFELKGKSVLQGIFHDITMRKQAEKTVTQRLEFERTVSSISSLFVGVYDIDSAIYDSLRHMGRLSGASRSYLFLLRANKIMMDNTHEWCAERVDSQKDFLQNLPCEMFPWWMKKLNSGETIHIQDTARMSEEAKTEKEILESQNIKSLLVLPVIVRGELAGFIGFDNVVTPGEWGDYNLALLRISAEIIGNALERERAQEEMFIREERMLQVQKMEAIGNLAGGVAHDFNNLLTTIKGYGEMLLNELHPDDPRYMYAKEVLKSAHRASLFTRQLLAFSRRQVLQQQILDLGNVINNMEKMLKPMLGETVALQTIGGDNLKRVKADQSQMEQVIMNLAVNARDAMPGGGILTIKVENASFTRDECAHILEARSGEFVCVSVSDSGVGMDKEVIQHIFEPFFTTKGAGKGTGIGLSVIYGIIKQHDGWIHVISEPEKGSTFNVYLPVSSGVPDAKITESAPLKSLPGKGERILLVEDEDGVRKLASEALEKHGYTIYAASTSEEALELFSRENKDFILVFSDVVLPDSNGVALVDKLQTLKPQLKILMTSGYTGEQSQADTIQNKGYWFLPKPYSLPELLQIIRDAIDSE